MSESRVIVVVIPGSIASFQEIFMRRLLTRTNSKHLKVSDQSIFHSENFIALGIHKNL